MVLGREFKRGLAEGAEQGRREVLLQLISERFGEIPVRIVGQVNRLSASQAKETTTRLLKARTLEDLLS